MSFVFLLQNTVEDLKALLNHKGGIDLFDVAYQFGHCTFFLIANMYEMYYNSW